MMSWGPHNYKGLKLVCQVLVGILANFIALGINKIRIFPWKFGSSLSKVDIVKLRQWNPISTSIMCLYLYWHGSLSVRFLQLC